MNELPNYKEANVKKYADKLQRPKFSAHPIKQLALDRFRNYCAKLVDKDEVVLDNGGGPGVYTDILRAEGVTQNVHAVDLSAAALAERNPKDVCKVGDMEALPYADGFFDRVLFIGALHHVLDTSQALSEARRVLKPRGRVVLDEPASLRMLLKGEGIRATEDPAEFSFSLAHLLKNLRANGFTIERIYYHGFVGRFVQRFGIGALRAAERIEGVVNAVPLLRDLLGVLSDYVTIVARKA
jgi:SAM-dependent methyltransferase